MLNNRFLDSFSTTYTHLRKMTCFEICHNILEASFLIISRFIQNQYDLIIFKFDEFSHQSRRKISNFKNIDF